MRDIRDYRIFSEAMQRYVIGGSAFNIKDPFPHRGAISHKKKSVSYTPNTLQKTGQSFTGEALERVFYYSQGQPWLVNAIGRTVCFEELAVPREQAITADHVRKAVEVLILRRDVHLDSTGR